MSSEAKKIVPVVIDDGFDVEEDRASFIVGPMLKFNNGKYFADKVEEIPIGTELVARAVITAWVLWQDGKPVEHLIPAPGQPRPKRDTLGHLDESKWEFDKMRGEPRDPWRDSRYLHLIDPRTGKDYTFVTDSIGGLRAISDLKRQINNVRAVRPGAVPLVALCSASMPTSYGPRPRPEFRVLEWRGGTPAEEPLAQIVDQTADRGLKSKPAKKSARAEEPAKPDYDDEIDF